MHRCTKYQKERIDKAKASIAKRDYLKNEQAGELVTKWLNEYSGQDRP